LASQTKNLEVQSQDLAVQAEGLRSTYRRLLFSVISILGVLVLAIGAAGIFVTHKVAGPIFKMRRHLREVAAGDLRVPSGLRKGDELVEFFAGFQSMVGALRGRREEQISDLLAARDATLSGDQSGAMDAMNRLERSLRAGLE